MARLQITSDQVIKAMIQHGYSPNPRYVDAVVSRVNAEFSDLNEAAMFLAQCGHESGGYQYIEEIAYAGGQYGGQYGIGAPGKSYHGRGFIQLSWPDNYRAASQAIGRGDDLYNWPEIVSEDPDVGAAVSTWYWIARVRNYPGVRENHFGASTKAINGVLECNGQNIEQSRNRYEIYRTVVQVLGVSNPADECGCYN